VSRIVVRVASQALVLALFAAAAVLGTASGVFFVYAADLPQISALDDYSPSTITRVLARDSQVIGEFATERRVVIGYDQISPRLRQAIIASEDQEFDHHFGLSIPRIVVALVKDLVERRKAAGASTLTQQLARNLFPDTIGFQKTWERKIKEALVAIQIEKRYTKPEIFTLYCNQIYLGHGAYGVEAASRLYFGKSARDLALEEAALIAGIIQLPSRQSPYVDVDRARARRNYALTRMAEDGHITPQEAEAARQAPVRTVGLQGEHARVAPYFVEDVRKYLEAKYGAKPLYEHGLTVKTSLDLRLQEAAERALDEGLRQLDRRRGGWRKPARNLLAEGVPVEKFNDPSWRALVPGAIVPALVLDSEGPLIVARVAGARVEVTREGFAWTGRRAPRDLVARGDVIEVRLGAKRADADVYAATLEQPPAVQGALVALDNRSGQILAMVGGANFDRSKFNRAVQAYRQLGSTFKPVVYTAAIDRGFTPATVLVDAPTSFAMGPGQPPYSPTNYDGRYEGPITLRRAVEQSRNVPAVKVMSELGPKQVLEYAKRLGFESTFPPYLSTALGAGEATLLEVTSAFSVFPGQGVRMRPYQVMQVVDREGNVREENRPQPVDAIRADTAYVMTSLLQGVVLRGTAARAASLDWPLGGKTGTTNDYTDAWFIGFDPDITVGVWVGYDQKRPLGPAETGSAAALPIWMAFMQTWIAGRESRPEFPTPGNVLFVSVDRGTGTATDGSAEGAFREVFISGTQPGADVQRDR
jgi:penicillin-binding protein 1A